MLVSAEFEGTLADVSDQIHEYSDPKTLKMNISACFDFNTKCNSNVSLSHDL